MSKHRELRKLVKYNLEKKLKISLDRCFSFFDFFYSFLSEENKNKKQSINLQNKT